MPLDLEILFEDEHCLVVNKPSGLSTQAPRSIDSLEVRVRAYLQSIVNADMAYWQCDPSGQAPEVYLGLPHRLDRPVSGVIVLAKTKKGARKISSQFERRLVEKKYWALVEGCVEPATGTWTDFLRKIPDEAKAEIIPPDHLDAQQAVLHYRTLGATPHGSWLEIELETGRMHQIRLQAASRGFPVLGDALYGSRVPFGPQFEDQRLRAIALHAQSLSFTQPLTQARLTITAHVSAAWKSLGIGSDL
jgi:23S rRNA pseudouridine1911/1915/1917 synthase